ncbi:succinylglutamate desuccinylase/aspartoacylase domain-containing protein [Pseudomonas akapageensis]|uniref:succinylglutamate desuccinylase/aspartoacylase domain-containing protein n=1 Tax=Pseudomonas akapageensis TaxID=2609961 RepID=UPI00140DDA04
MQTQNHPLLSPSCGTHRHVTSFHFGTAAATGGWPGKVYIQSGLHAGEIPGMLVSHHLKAMLTEAEAQGRLRGEVVLVPLCNPIGVSQALLQYPVGRFEFSSGENFNRYYLSPDEELATRVADELGQDEAQNRTLIRRALGALLDEVQPQSELASLRLVLQKMSCDADLVIDLHSESEGLLHVYAARGQWERVEALARYLHCPVSLLADYYGDTPFDEAVFMPWQNLRRRFPDKPIPYDSVSVTVELRGEQDVSHQQAIADATAIFDYLVHQGLISGTAAPLPQLPYPTTPLEGSQTLIASVAGVLAKLLPVGTMVAEGDQIAEIVDPVTGHCEPVYSPAAGLLYARSLYRFVKRGDTIAKVAGSQASKKARLLDA